VVLSGAQKHEPAPPDEVKLIQVQTFRAAGRKQRVGAWTSAKHMDRPHGYRHR
jgi:hypothetical protein